MFNRLDDIRTSDVACSKISMVICARSAEIRKRGCMISTFKLVVTAVIAIVVSGCAVSDRSYNSLITTQANKSIEWVKQNKATCGVFWPVSAIRNSSYHAGKSYVKQWGHLKDGIKDVPAYYAVCYTDQGRSEAAKGCANYHGEPCELVFYRPYGTPETTHYTNLDKLWLEARDNKLAIEQAELREKQERELALATEARSSTCNSFGFLKGSESHSKCMFELYKLEEMAKQNQLNRAAVTNAAAEQNRILQQQLEEQKFESGMRLLQQSAEMLNAPSPKVTCKLNQITQTVVCN